MRFILAVATGLALSAATIAQTKGPDGVDFLRLAEAFRLARTVHASMWPGWEATPFPVLLVAPEREFLVGFPRTPPGFTDGGYSGILQTPIRTRVGHSFIKQVMAETGAVFGGEHSGHYYFRDNYRADSGLIAAVVAIEQLSLAGRPLSEVLAPFRRYRASGEVNSRVDDQVAKVEEIAAAYASGRQDRTDGLTIEFDDWWFNVRPSNTEPLLRLNLEAPDRDECDQHVAQLLALITSL